MTEASRLSITEEAPSTEMTEPRASPPLGSKSASAGGSSRTLADSAGRVSNRASLCSVATAGAAAPSVCAGIDALRRRSASMRSPGASAARVFGSAVIGAELLRHRLTAHTLVECIFEIEWSVRRRLPSEMGDRVF